MTDSRSSDLTNQPPGYLRRNHAPVCLWFWAWAMVGAAGAVGLASRGPIALGPAAIAGVAMTASRVARQSTLGLLAGAGLLCLFVAYVQREGPGARAGTPRPPVRPGPDRDD